MTKINGTVIEQSIEVADSDRGLGSTESLRRMIDAGERRFWAKRGYPAHSSWTMRHSVKAGAMEGYSAKREAADE